MIGKPEASVTEAGNAEFKQVYERLRALAHRERRRYDAGQTLNTTALVHEVYIDLSVLNPATVPRDFYGYAARAMRNLLIDRARRRMRPKHGGDLRQCELDSAAADDIQMDAALALELDSALSKLAVAEPRAAEIVELHYFAGVALAEIATLLDISERTVNRDWRVARAWLQREMAA